MKRSNSSRSLALRTFSSQSANSRCASSRRRRSSSSRASSALFQASNAALPEDVVKPCAQDGPRPCRTPALARGLEAVHRRARALIGAGRHRLQVGSAGLALPILVAEDRQPERPEDHEAEDHRDQLDRRPAAARACARPGRPTETARVGYCQTRLVCCSSRASQKTDPKRRSPGRRLTTSAPVCRRARACRTLNR